MEKKIIKGEKAMDFDSFLNKMENETGTKLSIPTISDIKEEQEKQSIPETKPKPKRKKVKKVVEQKMEEDNLNEDFVEKIYEVTGVIMKSIRTTFPDKQHRSLAFESVRTAIDMYLGESKTIPIVNVQRNVEPTATLFPKSSMTKPIKESEYKYEDEDILNTTTQINENNSSQYTRHINIKPGQGLDGVSKQDISELKLLAGIG